MTASPPEQIERILHGKIDVGFIHVNLDHPQLASKIVQRGQLVVALPKTLQVDGPVDQKAITDMTIFVPRPLNSTAFGFHGHIQKAFQASGTEPARLVHTNLASAIHLVVAGAGTSIVPSVFQTLGTPGVVFRSLMWPAPPVDLSVAWSLSAKSKIPDRFLGILDQLKTM